MIIKESLGIITDSDKVWNKLAEIISDYVYDILNGLNSNPFYEGNETVITKNNIIGYILYEGLDVKEIIPEWIGDFTIKLGMHILSKGNFERSTAELKDNALYFHINIKDDLQGPDDLKFTLVHEFRHAYTRYLELTKNFTLRNKVSNKTYIESRPGFRDEKFNKDIKFVSKIGPDYLVLKNDIWDNASALSGIILRSFYFTDRDELNSYLLEFADEMQSLIDMNKDSISETIKKNDSKKKFDFNLRANNVSDEICITCYSSTIFTTYKAYLMFWLNIKKIDEDLAWDVVNLIKRGIKTYLDINISKKILNFSGDATLILDNLSNRQIPILSKMIRKMENIYVYEIQNVNTKEELKEVLKLSDNDENTLLDFFK